MKRYNRLVWWSALPTTTNCIIYFIFVYYVYVGTYTYTHVEGTLHFNLFLITKLFVWPKLYTYNDFTSKIFL